MSVTYRVLHEGKPLELDVVFARGFWARTWGWLGRHSLKPNDALWIEPCARVHTLGMRVAISIVMLSPDGYVIALQDRISPWNVGPMGVFKGVALELAPGAVSRFGIRLGDRLTLKGSSR